MIVAMRVTPRLAHRKTRQAGQRGRAEACLGHTPRARACLAKGEYRPRIPSGLSANPREPLRPRGAIRPGAPHQGVE